MKDNMSHRPLKLTTTSPGYIGTWRPEIEGEIARLKAENAELRADVNANTEGWEALIKERDALRQRVHELEERT